MTYESVSNNLVLCRLKFRFGHVYRLRNLRNVQSGACGP